MSVKLSVISPVLNEVDFIGYSILAALDQIHEFIYAIDEESDDGTRDLLEHIRSKYAHEKLVILETPNFHPLDMPRYNGAFNACIEKATGDACFFLHPDMIITNPSAIPEMPESPQAWFTHMTSYAKDFGTVYTAGRGEEWKNIHRKQFGLHYFGAYGSVNEDFYHSDITGNSHQFHGREYDQYPFEIGDSGIQINHYCEMKPYSRRLEKMRYSLTSQFERATKEWIDEQAVHHPRVTLEQGPSRFGVFQTAKTETPIPEVFEKYKQEFEQFKKTPIEA